MLYFWRKIERSIDLTIKSEFKHKKRAEFRPSKFETQPTYKPIITM